MPKKPDLKKKAAKSSGADQRPANRTRRFRAPGVYVGDVPAGTAAIAGVSTSKAVFIGIADAGEVQRPVNCQSQAEFEQAFPAVGAARELTRAVRLFFQNGGTQATVIRILQPTLAEYQSALTALERQTDPFALLILPQDGGLDAAGLSELWQLASAVCRTRRAFLLLDPPRAGNTAWARAADVLDATAGIDPWRSGMARDYSALYYPRVLVEENGATVAAGASGAIAGLMARIDAARGVWKAPAGVEADIRGIAGLEDDLSDAALESLNVKGVNVLRRLPGRVCCWGARTLDGDEQYASEWKYVPVRRLANYVEQSLDRGLAWTVFEPNDEPLWARIRSSIESFLFGVFRDGALRGATPDEAYFVRCDRSTMTAEDIALGRVQVRVGLAVLRPGEFVILPLQLRSASENEGR